MPMILQIKKIPEANKTRENINFLKIIFNGRLHNSIFSGALFFVNSFINGTLSEVKKF